MPARATCSSHESPPNQMSSSSVLPSDRQHFLECKLEDTQDMSKLDANDSFIKTQPEEELYEPSDSALTFMVLSLFSLLFSIAWIIIKIPIKICILLKDLY